MQIKLLMLTASISAANLCASDSLNAGLNNPQPADVKVTQEKAAQEHAQKAGEQAKQEQAKVEPAKTNAATPTSTPSTAKATVVQPELEAQDFGMIEIAPDVDDAQHVVSQKPSAHEAPHQAMPAQEQREQKKETQMTPVVTPPTPQPVIAPLPQKVSQPMPVQTPQVPAPKQEKTMNIDTVDMTEPSGNWLFKRIWWEKAEALYDVIKNKVEQVRATNTNFENRRIELDRTVFDPFYLAIGMSQGELNAIIDHIFAEVEKLQEREGSLTKQERDFLDVLATQKKALEQLRLDVQGITQADATLEEALQRLKERVDICRNYEQQSWNHFRSIAKELSDKRARELYYTMETMEKNVDSELAWARGQFTVYFDQQVKSIQEQAARIQAAVKELQEKGLDFKNQLKHIQEQVLKDDQERADQEVQDAIEKTTQEMSIMSRLGRIWDSCVAAVVWVWDSITGFFSGLFGSSSSEQVIESEQVMKIAPVETAPVQSVPAMQENVAQSEPVAQPEVMLEPAQQQEVQVPQPQEPVSSENK